MLSFYLSTIAIVVFPDTENTSFCSPEAQVS